MIAYTKNRHGLVGLILVFCCIPLVIATVLFVSARDTITFEYEAVFAVNCASREAGQCQDLEFEGEFVSLAPSPSCPVQLSSALTAATGAYELKHCDVEKKYQKDIFAP